MLHPLFVSGALMQLTRSFFCPWKHPILFYVSFYSSFATLFPVFSPSFIHGFLDWKWTVHCNSILHYIVIASFQSPIPSSLILFLSTAIDCYSLSIVRSHYKLIKDQTDECILLFCVNPVILIISSSLSAFYCTLQLLFLLFLLDETKKQHALQFLILLLLCFQNPLFISLLVFRHAYCAYWLVTPFLLFIPLPVGISNNDNPIESNHTVWRVFLHLFWCSCHLCTLPILYHPRHYCSPITTTSSHNGE